MIGKDAIAKVLDAELNAAISAAQSADKVIGGTQGMRQTALAYYDGVLPANDDKNGDAHRSAVSMDVADMVEAVYAQMAPSIEEAGGIEFEAVSAEDEPEAARETAIVRAMLMEGHASEGGFVSLTESIKDSLLMRTGTLALYVDRTETRTPERWEDVSADGIDEIIATSGPDERIEGLTITASEREEGEEGAEVEGSYVLDFVRVTVDKRLTMSAIAPENFVTSSLSERDPNKSRFCADRIVTTRAQLIARGFDAKEVAKLKRHDPTTYELYLQRHTETTLPEDAAQTSTETVEVWRCYAMLGEREDSPRAERFRVYYSRDNKAVVGEPEKVGRVCYAVGNVILFPHRFDGVSLFDKLGEVQVLKSLALRNWVENLNKVNRPRLGVDESLANLDDAMDATKDVIRMYGANGIIPVPVLDAGPSVQAFLNYQDQCRSERGGASLDMQTSSAQIATNQTASGIERQYSVKEQLAAAMARTFAETAMRSAFQIAHYLLRTSWGTPIKAKLGGEWQEVDPTQWRPRSGVVVRTGESATQRAKKSIALTQVMQAQAGMMSQGLGGIMTDESKMFNAATDWITAQQLRSPERYLIDPSSKQAQQARQGKQQQQQASMQAQGDAARATLMLEKYKVDVKALTDTLSDMVKAAVEEAKLTMSTEPIDEVQAQGDAIGANAAQQAQSAAVGGGASSG